MRKAIVTGASSGIGWEIAIRLTKLGYDVYGFGRHFTGQEPFHTIAGDLLDTSTVLMQIQQVNREKDVKLLVNCAGCAYYGLHEELSPEKISEMTRTNLELPMILTQQLLRTLKKNQGTIINVSSVTAVSSNPHGAAYGATKAGLSSFSRSLFDEARKYGVKVTAILPDMTQTNLYRNADFTASDEPECSLTPEEVAESVEFILKQPDGVVIPELVIRPQKHRLAKKAVPEKGKKG